jgi:DNA-binding winged helix-turn-helix (wHTH) protein
MSSAIISRVMTRGNLQTAGDNAGAWKGVIVIVEFEDFVLNTRARSLFKRGSPLRLQPKVMDLLIVLIENHKRYISKQEIFAALWTDVHVGSASLLRLVAQLRRVLGDDSERPRLIRTLHSRGYQFIGDVRESTAPSSSLVEHNPYGECAS